jgi:hypothetical protein
MQEKSLAYCAVVNAAMGDLERICAESERLMARLSHLDQVVEALKPMIEGPSDRDGCSA